MGLYVYLYISSLVLFCLLSAIAELDTEFFSDVPIEFFKIEVLLALYVFSLTEPLFLVLLPRCEFLVFLVAFGTFRMEDVSDLLTMADVLAAIRFLVLSI